MKQKELAEALGLSPSHLSEIESGKKQVTIDVLQRYADYFKIPASSLLYFAEQKDQLSQRRDAPPIAKKAIKMLDWIDTISREEDPDEDEVRA